MTTNIAHIDVGLSERRAQVDRLEELLRSEVRACCPGDHAAVQHRDRKPPWCPLCGRDDRGRRQAPCPTCTAGPSRETTGLVCLTCGTDYGNPA